MNYTAIPEVMPEGKTVLVYKSVMGAKGRLELDLNYIYRIPLWEVIWSSSPIWPKETRAKILDIHELAAGKLNALLEREVSRDLFDSHQLLTKWMLNPEKLRLAFTVYAGMRKQEWQQISIDNVNFSVKDIRDKLLPVLKQSEAPFDTRFPAIEKWAKEMVNACKSSLDVVLPFRKNEIEFLEQLQQYGKIRPELISGDNDFCERVRRHPLLRWRTQHLTK